MKRRRVLATTGIALSAPLVGCLNTATGVEENNTRSQSPTDDKSDFQIRFAEQEGDTAESVRERVLIKNSSEESQYISGYTLTYSSGYEYTFSGGLTLEPRSTVAVVSQGAGDSVAESDPPTYYRNADLPELVLEDGEETIRLLNQEDELVVEETFNAQD
ncbi:lamin tail domain-containing protein [Halosolutus halophilus]|uniref:lamin tail domain-containing protein n=1 Tax=Halosolutus halophilus TaxID=1552990 RepID=UPI002234F635|nr:lamin tail domain-containing protein [Halosolutus halophilus]